MLSLLVTNDQPGVAARIVHSGCGLMIPIARADATRIRGALRTILDDPSFRERAKRMAAANREARGAADLIEGLELAGGGELPTDWWNWVALLPGSSLAVRQRELTLQ
jgi:zeaxanthin glucosyltransferase